jgi:uncharacterized protein YbaP (TraB family)
MKRTLSLLFFCCVFLFPDAFAQSGSSWPKTLLWRISGNGLSKNSFLYGTMHLQDKRLFYFSDSLYHYLEQAEGYALEIDIRELMDSLIKKAIDEKEEQLIDKIRLLQPKEKKKILDSLVENVIRRNDKASKTALKDLRDEKMRKILKKEMPTLMDAFLYDIARKQDKWLGGIEDLQDQLSVYNEMGNNVTAEELLVPDKEMAAFLERMIKSYLAKDLNEIQKMTESGDPEDELLLKRNIKMARRMDSLSNIRSMFFAVGAAHLPGDSGVINLLKKRGFNVNPVFSSGTVDPFEYTSHLKTLPWVKNSDKDKTYEIEMPGVASDFKMLNDFNGAKVYVDITTLTFFISASAVTQKEVDLSSVLEGLSDNNQTHIISKKLIEKDSARGIESILISNDHYFKVQYLFKGNTLYMFMAGGDKKELTESPDVKRFFSSVKMNESQLVQSPRLWSSFGLKEKAFTAMFPGKPERNASLESQSDSLWKIEAYNYTDIGNDVYYMAQIRDIQPGNYLDNDSVSFSFFKEYFQSVVKKDARDEFFTIQSFPAFVYEGIKDDVFLKSLVVNRGNRIYYLSAGGKNTADSRRDINYFINSFELKEYETPSWGRQTAPRGNFYMIAPPVTEIRKDTNATEEQRLHFISYNPVDCISYELFKSNLPTYYWTANDSTYFESIGTAYVTEPDSVLSKRSVRNGNLTGVEWLVKTHNSNNLKKFRLLLNGDTLYTLISFIPSQYVGKKEYCRFFEEFRIINENRSPTIFESKASLLLADLRSTESSVHAKALAALSDAAFSKDDMPLLQTALLESYPTDSTGVDPRQKIVDILQDMTDSSTIEFIRENFPLQAGKNEVVKFYLLDLLARHKTSRSYSVLKELLLNHTPMEKQDMELSFYINDSLKLTRQLYPEILQLSSNIFFTERIMTLSNELLDSGMISLDMLLPHKRDFYTIMDSVVLALSNKDENEYNSYYYKGMIHLLHYFNDSASNRLLYKYLRLDNKTLKIEAIVGLLNNNRHVDAKEIELVGADKINRRDFYEELKIAGKQKYFPTRFLTQQFMAESDIHNYSSDDAYPDKIFFLGTRTITYKKEKKRFYLFKVIFIYENEDGKNEESQYLGIAGPYSMDLKELETDNEVTGLFYDEKFDAKKIEKYFAEYMKGFAEQSLVN